MELEHFSLDFVKKWCRGEKFLLKLADLKHVDAPRFHELSVPKIYEEVKDFPGTLAHLPDRLEPPHK